MPRSRRRSRRHARERRAHEVRVIKLLSFVGATVGGYVGWAAGEPVGLFTAFAISMVGTGAGMYVGRRIGRHYEG